MTVVRWPSGELPGPVPVQVEVPDGWPAASARNVSFVAGTPAWGIARANGTNTCVEEITVTRRVPNPHSEAPTDGRSGLRCRGLRAESTDWSPT